MKNEITKRKREFDDGKAKELNSFISKLLRTTVYDFIQEIKF